MKISKTLLAMSLLGSLLGASAMDAAVAMPITASQAVHSTEATSPIVEARYMRHHRVRRSHRNSNLGRRHCRKFSSRCTNAGAMTP